MLFARHTRISRVLQLVVFGLVGGFIILLVAYFAHSL
jgi:hypothetical protein